MVLSITAAGTMSAATHTHYVDGRVDWISMNLTSSVDVLVAAKTNPLHLRRLERLRRLVRRASLQNRIGCLDALCAAVGNRLRSSTHWRSRRREPVRSRWPGPSSSRHRRNSPSRRPIVGEVMYVQGVRGMSGAKTGSRRNQRAVGRSRWNPHGASAPSRPRHSSNGRRALPARMTSDGGECAYRPRVERGQRTAPVRKLL